MAVAGLPDIDDEHVVQMARFANEMLLQMKRVTTDMDAYLGGTRDLNLRIGINSGPVTAGVLRGQKARFQLFGDTVNTAARMESHSIPGKVQISQSTADLLLKAGKVSWIQAREGLINAKGKGELKTYWLVADAIAGENRDTSPAKSAYSPLSSLPIEMKTVDLEEPSHHEEPVMIPLACKHSPTNSLSQPRYRALSRFNSSLSSPPPLDSLNVGSRYDVDV